MTAHALWDAIALDPQDDVAVALRDLGPGERVRVRCEASEETLTARDAIPLGHKIARRDLAAGALVHKYGTPIGEASAPVRRGAHVHVHNLKSRRARR